MDEKQNENKRLMPSIEDLEEELINERNKHTYKRALKSTIFTLLVVAAVAVIVAVLIMPVLQISGSSMSNTLNDGDIVLAINTSKFKSGDVVALHYNNSILIKRVIACAGDTIDIDEDGTVYVNGEALDEPYVSEKALGDCNIDLPFQVPTGRLFVMGDHRETSIDSRNKAIGAVPDDMMIGKLIFRVWPFAGIGIVR